MKKILVLICWFCIGSVLPSFGQENDTLNLYSKKHFVFFNTLQVIDLNGSSLQFGYDYRVNSSMYFQLEVGFMSDNILNWQLPFQEYLGFRIRPQVRFSNKKNVNQDIKLFSGFLLSYQDLNFKENNDFEVENSFFQNISYSGRDKTYGWYIIGGLDVKSSNWLIASLSIGVGQVWINTKVDEGMIPENAIIFEDCAIFCGRGRDTINRLVNRPAVLAEIKIGYMF